MQFRVIGCSAKMALQQFFSSRSVFFLSASLMHSTLHYQEVNENDFVEGNIYIYNPNQTNHTVPQEKGHWLHVKKEKKKRKEICAIRK